MPLITPPPSTWLELVYDGRWRWRLTTTAFLFTALTAMFATLFFLALLLAAIVSFRYFLLSAPLTSDAGAAPWSDVLGPVGTPLALAAFGILFLIVFLFLLIAIVLPPLDPEVFALRVHSFLGAPCGLDPAIINTFPKAVYSTVKGHRISEASLECAVCLNDFEDHDTLCLIPRCHHAFHPDCVGKLLASHVTCPICRADLTSQPAGDSASQLAWPSPYLPGVKVRFEAAPPDGGAPERSLREGRRERIQPPDPWDKNESRSFNNGSRTRDSGEIRGFSRPHSTGHSLGRPSEDTERFTLRLPAEVWKQLMDRPGPVLPLEGCSSR